MTWSIGRLLTGLVGVLALVLALEWLLPDAPPPPAAAPRVHAVVAPAAEVAERDTSDWADTVLARPLFSIGRRPPRVLAGGHAEPAAGQSRLAGIMITQSGRRAIFAPEGGGRALVLGEGATVNQSTIRGIFADHVVLASGTILKPSYDRNRSTATTSPFQPAIPNFPNPGFPNTNFPTFAPGGVPPFAPGGVPPFAPGGVPQPGIPPQAGGDDGSPPAPAFNPAFRGNLIPPRRE